MKVLYPHIGLEKLCTLFGKTRQAYYDHCRRASNAQLQEGLMIDLVKSVRRSMPRIGGLKLLRMLEEDFATHRLSIGRDRFYGLLRKHKLLVRIPKRYAVTTNSNHPYKKWKNLVKGISATESEQIWVSDITYLKTKSCFLYLSLITDAYSRKILGYHLSQTLKAQGCLIALNKAIGSRTKNTNVIHHSDRGIQYCCQEYVDLLHKNGISISMTESGSPYDNAIAERINGILKTELRLGEVFDNYTVAVPAVHQAINTYNRIRPHYSVSGLTPEKAHITNDPVSRLWKTKKYCKAISVSLHEL